MQGTVLSIRHTREKDRRLLQDETPSWSSFLFNIELKVLATAIRQEKHKRQVKRRDLLFTKACCPTQSRNKLLKSQYL